jgi:hypothetical protein
MSGIMHIGTAPHDAEPLSLGPQDARPHRSGVLAETLGKTPRGLLLECTVDVVQHVFELGVRHWGGAEKFQNLCSDTGRKLHESCK